MVVVVGYFVGCIFQATHGKVWKASVVNYDHGVQVIERKSVRYVCCAVCVYCCVCVLFVLLFSFSQSANARARPSPTMRPNPLTTPLE